MQRIKVRKDKSLTNYPYVWHYTVEHDPPREDALDYGSLVTQQEALVEACWALCADSAAVTA